MARTGSRRLAAAVSVLLLAGALADAVTDAVTVGGHGLDPVLARVAGEPPITRVDVAGRVASATSPAVRSQFTPAEVTAHVLTELIGLELDRRLAAQLGVTPAARGSAVNDPTAQQQQIRTTGRGWAGTDVTSADAALRAQLAAAEVRLLQPVPVAELQAEYTAALGTYQHAHIQVLTTPDRTVATRDAALGRADPARFPALARADTDDEAHRAAGGDYGPALARGQLYAAVDDAVFAAKPGSVVGPVSVAQAVPEYYVVRVVSVVDIPLSSVTAALTAQALDPTGSYVQGPLAQRRRRLAAGVNVAPDAGRFDVATLSVVPPASSAGAAPG